MANPNMRSIGGETNKYGDYPETEVRPSYFKNPYLKYDDKQGRRNNGEIIHPLNDMYDIWSPDRFDIVSDKTAFKYFMTAVGAFGAFITVLYVTADHESPAVRRQYPFDGLNKALGGTEETKEVYQARVDEGYGSKQ
jgi:NADH dehydrogenase (ubiquinone) 1 beta subcomplex subunit 8